MAEQNLQRSTPNNTNAPTSPVESNPIAPDFAGHKQETVAHTPGDNTPATGFLARIREKRRSRAQKVSLLEGSVKVPEVKALIRFVSERGMDAKSQITGPLHEAIAKLDLAKSKTDYVAANAEVLKLYSELCKLTYPTLGVNGRTIQNTSAALFYMLGLIIISMFFLTGAFASEIIQYSDKTSFTLEGVLAPDTLIIARAVIRVVLEPLSPFFWGGVGSCIFILKTLSDRVTSTTFDSGKFHVTSYLTRILLGAVLGYVVASLLFVQAEIQTQNVGPDAIAFLAGLGTKAVYGGLETLIQMIYRRTVSNMQTNSGNPAAPDPVAPEKPLSGSPVRPPEKPAATTPSG